MAILLSTTEIQTQLSQVPQWQHQGATLVQTKTFGNFVEAIKFVNALVDPAETRNHHPDIAISYNKVTITLTSHDAGGLTALDFDLAQAIDRL